MTWWSSGAQVELVTRPSLFFATCDEADPSEQPVYEEVNAAASLRTTLEAKLVEYNESNPVMDLVLFDQVRIDHRHVDHHLAPPYRC